MQGDIQKLQEDLGKRTFEGSAGGGVVLATSTGDGQLVSLKISPEIFRDGDAEMLQDLVLSAVQDACQRARDTAQKEMSKLTGGLGLPPGLI